MALRPAKFIFEYNKDVEQHPFFGLWLHSTTELSRLVNRQVVERVTLHEWPLSTVQKLVLADGSRLIYKAQYQEGVEEEFYERISSPLLVWHRTLGNYKNTTAMLLEYLEAPRLVDSKLTESEVVVHGRKLVAAIQQIGWEAPVYADLATATQWEHFVDGALSKAAALIDAGTFRRVQPAALAHLAQWSRSAPVLDAIRTTPVLNHADLTGENVFLTPSGYKVIDWQYPRIAPDGFDLACFLDNMGCDARKYVNPVVVDIMWFVRLAWFTECQARLYPSGDRYDENVAGLAEYIIENAGNY